MAARNELPPLDAGLVASLVEGRHPRPHDWLGAHPHGDGWVIRAIRPLAETVTAVRADGTEVPLAHVADGLWQGFAPGDGQAYELDTTLRRRARLARRRPVPLRAERRRDRPLPVGRGPPRAALARARRALQPHEGVDGTGFVVWAPHAQAARVVGDFNGWNGLGPRHAPPRRQRGLGAVRARASAPGGIYKFELLTPRRRVGHPRRPDGALHRGAARRPARSSATALTTGATAGWLAARAAIRPAQRRR